MQIAHENRLSFEGLVWLFDLDLLVNNTDLDCPLIIVAYIPVGFGFGVVVEVALQIEENDVVRIQLEAVESVEDVNIVIVGAT